MKELEEILESLKSKITGINNINDFCILSGYFDGLICDAYKDCYSDDEYSKRLSKFCNLNIIELQDEKLPSKLNDSIINEIKNKEKNLPKK